MRKKIIGVIGGRACNKEVEDLAMNLGKKLAKVADIVVSGGLDGVMKAVSRGVKDSGGITMGILPGYDKNDANPYIDIVIPSGMGLARNVLVVKASDVVVALPGESGTLSEIAYCLQFSIPVISFNSWDIPGVIKCTTIEEVLGEISKRLK
ncbi:MAG: TIGR00725 family protein [Candidatus Omnitrophota bacterium]